MSIRYVKPLKMNHPYRLSDGDFMRIENAFKGKQDYNEKSNLARTSSLQ